MAKTKYKFNPETLSYDKISFNFKRLVKSAIPVVLTSIMLTFFLYFVVFYYFIDSPKEKKLRRENMQLKAQYEVLNDKMELADNVLGNLEKRDNNIYRTIFEAEPIPSSIREGGIGGSNRYEGLEGYDNSELVINTSRRLDQLLKKIEIQSKSFDQIVELVKNKEIMLSSIPAIQPISNKDLGHIASGFGFRIHPIYKTKRMHYGMDFTAARGSDVYVTGDGVVSEVKFSRRGYGNEIVIDHGFSYKTRYAHLQTIMVRQGQKVKRGEIIGTVGNTGLSSAPHLHYEVLYKNTAVNPVNYFYEDLTPEEYDRMVEISTQSGQTLD